MLELLGEAFFVTAIGFGGGFMLGLAARLGRFCTLGAIEDLLYGGNGQRLRMWGVAIGMAVLLSFGAAGMGWFSPDQSFYLSQPGSMLGAVIGGLVFGYGMALAGNCGFGALARLGGGDLRSFVIVLVMGLSSYVALSGPLARLRVSLFSSASFDDATTLSSMAQSAAQLTGIGTVPIGLATGLLILTISLLWRRHERPVSAHIQRPASMREPLLWGSVVGLAIASGWVGMQWVSEHGFGAHNIVSHTFSAPIGETMLYAMTSSGGMPGAGPGFGVGSVFGVLAGAFAGSILKGHFRWEACDDPRELRRQITGAVLMGLGAVSAAGCSIGQGVSAFSVLAWTAPLTLAAIWVGAAIGLRQLITGFAPAA